MKTIYSFILLSALISCYKLDVPNDTPQCIKKKIKEFKHDAFCSDADVKEYNFQTNTVYVFSDGTCGNDMGAQVYDNGCNNIGYLGSISGNTEINGEEFSNAVFVKVIWTK